MPFFVLPLLLVSFGVTSDAVAARPEAWCAQHHSVDLTPQAPRAFELVSLSGGETAGIMQRAMARVVVAILALALTACGPSDTERRTIRFTMPADGFASIHVEKLNGSVTRTLRTCEPFAKGTHTIVWDGLDNKGMPAQPGEYAWSGATHTGIHAKLRGWACADFGTPWRGAAGAQIWGGDAGLPSAVAADGERVYLGWSGAERGTSVLACDLDGKPLWGWRDPRENKDAPNVSGVRALAVDAGVVTVLGGNGGMLADGAEIFRLDAHTGALIPWPEDRRLTISSLWPADAKTKPDRANGMAARAGRIYLTFTEAQFLAVLDAQTGAYLQTVVGAPPELIDVVPTKTESPDKPGELMAADFALVSLRGGVLGKVLFAHDPLWVVVSDLQPLDRDERITALSVIGDGAKDHQHSVFVGLGAPFHQVQRRAILNTEGFLWSAGRAGGRQIGPWIPEALGAIRGVALDARGRLWVAEGDAVPRRFSVWETDGTEGRLVREFFGPLGSGSRIAEVFPTDPNVFVGDGCEWRVDLKSGQAHCTGVITQASEERLRFRQAENGQIELLAVDGKSRIRIFERVGEGHYEFRREGNEKDILLRRIEESEHGLLNNELARVEVGAGEVGFIRESQGVALIGAGDLVLAHLFDEPSAISDGPRRDARPATPFLGADLTHTPMRWLPRFTQMPDGRVFATAADLGLWTMEITGLDSIRPLPGGKLTVRTPAR
jgi:hypothetical protein